MRRTTPSATASLTVALLTVGCGPVVPIGGGGSGATTTDGDVPAVITVSEAEAKFVSVPDEDGFGVHGLSFALHGPVLTLSSTQAVKSWASSAANPLLSAVVEVHDDLGKLVTAKNVDKIPLQQGNQVVDGRPSTFRGATRRATRSDRERRPSTRRCSRASSPA